MFQIQKGINLSHWLSQVFGWSPRATFITEQDIIFIKQCGFDHVRLPIDEDQMWHSDGAKNTESFAYMHSCIQWCLDQQLKVVIDMHILRSHHFNAANDEGAMTLWDSVDDQNHMMDLWRELSAELHSYSVEDVAYEFMNEPVAPKHGMWNDLVAQGHKTIRALEPHRVLIFGPNMWQMPQFFKSFAIPAGDKNIIVSFHTYDPLPFTHYTAPWIPLGKYTGPISYPGTTIPDSHFELFRDANGDSPVGQIAIKQRVFSKETMLEVIQPALDFVEKSGLTLYCNEFGCLPTVGRADRLRYYTDLIDVFQSHNIAYASWDYKGDFGIKQWDRTTMQNGEIDPDLIAILAK